MFVSQVMDGSIYSEPSVERLIECDTTMNAKQSFLFAVHYAASVVISDIDRHNHAVSESSRPAIHQFRDQLIAGLIGLGMRAMTVHNRITDSSQLVPILADRAQVLSANVALVRDNFSDRLSQNEINHLTTIEAAINAFESSFA